MEFIFEVADVHMGYMSTYVYVVILIKRQYFTRGTYTLLIAVLGNSIGSL